MCDKDLLVAYLYDEIGDADRARADAHLRDCAACREELADLRGLRRGLTRWTPPQPDFDVRVVRARALSWRAWWTPAFGLAAAAVLVLAVASALAHVELRYGSDGFSVRTGWNAATPAVAAQATAALPVAMTAAQAAQFQAQYASLERRVNGLESAQQASPLRAVSAAAPARASDAEVLRQVRDLLAQSESRQQQELALRISQVLHDVDAQRVADLARIQQGFGRIDALTTQEAASHRDLVNYVMTASRQK